MNGDDEPASYLLFQKPFLIIDSFAEIFFENAKCIYLSPILSYPILSIISQLIIDILTLSYYFPTLSKLCSIGPICSHVSDLTFLDGVKIISTLYLFIKNPFWPSTVYNHT